MKELNVPLLRSPLFLCFKISTGRFMCHEFPITHFHQLGCQSPLVLSWMSSPPPFPCCAHRNKLILPQRAYHQAGKCWVFYVQLLLDRISDSSYCHPIVPTYSNKARVATDCEQFKISKENLHRAPSQCPLKQN